MSPEEADLLVGILRERIEQYDYFYYMLGEARVPNVYYDETLNRLKALEQQYPELVTEHSPTQRRRVRTNTQFQICKHHIPYYGPLVLEDEEAYLEWVHQTDLAGEGIMLQHSVVGVKVALTYEEGILVHAVTRGTGTEGEDVTYNCAKVKGVPLSLSHPKSYFRITVQGIVTVPVDTYEAEGEEYPALRNYVAASLRNIDPKVTAQRGLEFVVVDYLPDYISPEGTYHELKKEAQSQGFNTLEGLDPDDLTPSPYQTDGLIYTIDSLAQQERLGVTGLVTQWRVKLP